MAKILTVLGTPYVYPEQGTNPTWGDDASEWAEAVTDALGLVIGPNDIAVATVSIEDNQTSLVAVPQLLIPPLAGRRFRVTYTSARTDGVDGNINIAEAGTITGQVVDGDWLISYVKDVGDAGLEFDITSSGQVQYKSSSVGGDYTGSITYKAEVIDEL